MRAIPPERKKQSEQIDGYNVGELEIHILRKRLSDGSNTYGVSIGEVVYDCISEKDACAMAFKFAVAIKDHTNIEVTYF